MKRFLPLVLLTSTVAATPAAITLRLDSPSLTGNPGDTLFFTGTITNTGANEVFLNSLNLTASGIGLTTDTTPFYTSFPFSLTGGGSASGTLFSVAIDASAPSQTITGGYELLGGEDGGSFDLLASGTFGVTTPAVQAVPEPMSLSLLAGGLGVALRRRRRAV